MRSVYEKLDVMEDIPTQSIPIPVIKQMIDL